ncbi:MAG: DTW domain-containing protein [Leptospiraceae bacterium]|nr:DTW domain-containing protein [Leptospiraceae bacterium]
MLTDASMEPIVHRERCYRCFRPAQTCYCRDIIPVRTNARFIFLLHPREALHQRTGTGRLTHLSLPGSRLFVGLDFAMNAELMDLVFNDHFQTMLLYPGSSVQTAPTINAAATQRDERPYLFIVLDATWHLSRKLLRLNPWLEQIPRVGLAGVYRSSFRIKRQPGFGYLATIEAVCFLLREFEQEKLIRLQTDPAKLLLVFEKMVSVQESFIQGRGSPYRAPTNPPE